MGTGGEGEVAKFTVCDAKLGSDPVILSEAKNLDSVIQGLAVGWDERPQVETRGMKGRKDAAGFNPRCR